MLLSTDISRIQFAFTISFHILFPSFSIGLATFLLIMETRWIATKNIIYLNICKYWTKIFALTFGMGIVSGLVMEFQLGTNWSGYTKAVGPVLGSLFTYEVLTAFFIEAGFLGVMIFGWKRVSSKLHYLATLLVWIGVTLSAFWILSANSWMQTPAGVIFKNHHFIVNDWWQVIFNPSDIPRFLHMLIAAYLATSLVIAGVSGYYLLRRVHINFAKKCFSLACWALLLLTPLQIVIGDQVGLDIHKYQPLKTAAIEGVWNTQKGAPLLLFAYPDQTLQKNLWAVGIPGLASLINTHHWDGQLVGLKSVPRADQPIVAPVFYTFRIMVVIGILMLAMGVVSLYLRIRKRLYDSRWFTRIIMLSMPLGFIAIITGWITAEIGRQPWVVYNYIRTSQAVSPISSSHVITTFVLMIIVYGIIFGYFYFKYFIRLIKAGPTSKAEISQPFGYMHPESKITDKSEKS